MIPEHISSLPKPVQDYYKQVYVGSLNRTKDSNIAAKTAWQSTKSKLKKVDGKWVAHGFDFNFYTFDLDIKEDTFVTHAEDGNYYIEGVLTDTLPNLEGTQFTESALMDFAKQINEGGIFGGISHSEYKELIMKYSHLPTKEFYKKALTERKGVLRVIKAIYEKGKLWIKALIDKRYIKQIQKYKSMSIEAHIPSNMKSEGKLMGGKILGLALDNNPINPRTTVAIV